jgi:hypothetical protein
MNAVQKHREKNRSRGLCLYCPSPVQENFVVCRYHREKKRVASCERYLRIKVRQKAAGLCLFCSAPGSGGGDILLCPKHRAKLNSWSLDYYYQHYYGRPHKQRPRRRGPRPPSTALQYPYVGPNDCHDGLDLLLAINQAVPKCLGESVRAEVCQDLAVAILDGTVDLEKIDGAVPRFIRAVRRRFPVKFGPLSLDQPAFRGSNTLLRELVRA